MRRMDAMRAWATSWLRGHERTGSRSHIRMSEPKPASDKETMDALIFQRDEAWARIGELEGLVAQESEMKAVFAQEAREAAEDDWRSDEEAQALIDAIDRDPAPPEPKATAERAYEPDDAQILDNLAWNIRQGNVVAANGTMGATATALERVAKKLRASARAALNDKDTR